MISDQDDKFLHVVSRKWMFNASRQRTQPSELLMLGQLAGSDG